MKLKKQTKNSMSIREWCAFSGVTLTALAEMIPCSQPYMGMIDSGKAHPSFKMAKRIEQCTNGFVSRKRWYPDDDDEVIGE